MGKYWLLTAMAIEGGGWYKQDQIRCFCGFEVVVPPRTLLPPLPPQSIPYRAAHLEVACLRARAVSSLTPNPWAALLSESTYSGVRARAGGKEAVGEKGGRGNGGK